MKKRRVKLGDHPGTALEIFVMDLCSEKGEGGSVFSNDKRLTETIQEQHCQERPMTEGVSLSNDKRLTESIQEQHCQERPMMES